jgi:hypothetical protein
MNTKKIVEAIRQQATELTSLADAIEKDGTSPQPADEKAALDDAKVARELNERLRKKKGEGRGLDG